MLMVVLVRMMVMVVVAMMVSMMNTSKGSLCKGDSWSKLLRHNHLVDHTKSKHCDALVTITMIIMLMMVVFTVTCSLESIARQVRTAIQRIERTPTF